jgi:hypothetical protein
MIENVVGFSASSEWQPPISSATDKDTPQEKHNLFQKGYN